MRRAVLTAVTAQPPSMGIIGADPPTFRCSVAASVLSCTCGGSPARPPAAAGGPSASSCRRFSRLEPSGPEGWYVRKVGSALPSAANLEPGWPGTLACRRARRRSCVLSGARRYRGHLRRL
jgi:hypothetical protein